MSLVRSHRRHSGGKLTAKHDTNSKSHKRRADVIAKAVRVRRIAAGEIDASGTTEDGKNKAAVALGRMGGKARAEKLGPKRRKCHREGRSRRTLAQIGYAAAR